ncbi:protein O-linked-mannose beta-1,2-N-acetylglucosaminyltransferase 1-like [Orbicella faveolata]|uniref:protein O-linked-mannose beta-1,2-N-acetylglucosaminyltransferase 1-like n=1 Tax=Orbicella faveolata TaxID=48498 RepID=UPI0009E4192E|nr:protein O-linked-mannose beta-1,2-N-acetylglucosaminyltransferase 1-like [Orbicella faveolata]
MAKRKKGISRGRVCIVLFLLILAGTSLLNIMSVLQTTSRTSSAEKEPVEYDVLFHRQSLKSVLPPVYWTREKTVLSKADDSDVSRRRKEFCDKYEGYDNVCNCGNPVFLDFNLPAFQDGSRLQLPMAIMAGNRPSYLLRMLFSLHRVEGLDPSLVTVFIDGFFDEPSSIAKLFQLNVEQHADSGKRNSRICQHYKKSLTASFDRYPEANYLVILEEDFDVSVDILSYFKQLLPVLENDESLYCISAWNDQGYDHLVNDPAMLYRVETMPGLGW